MRSLTVLVRERPCKRFAAGLLALSIAGATFAHDFWIEPGSFRPQTGAKVPLNLRIGTDFKGESAVFNPQYFNRYIVAGPTDEKPVDGDPGDEPAGTITASKPGLYAVLYDSKKFDVTFDNFDKFHDYLKEEGLERLMPFAKARAGNGGKINEVYSRCAKTLIATRSVVSGAASSATTGARPDDAAATRNFGCALELVPETNPYRPGPTRELRVQLLFKGAPVEGVLIIAFNKADPASKLRVRTDKEGRATLSLQRSGVWLVKGVHMTLMSRFTRGDWESFWASLTFEVPGQ